MSGTLKKLWKEFLDWVNGLGAQRSQEPTPDNRPATDILPAPEAPAVQRLQSGYVGTLVTCASCGIVHELEAVCHICGAPLCWDDLNCRIIKTDAELELLAVYCPTCAGER